MTSKNIRRIVTFVFIFFVALILRSWQLGTLPVGITHDEMDMVVTSKMVTLTGSDLSGRWKPWKLEPVKTATVMSELDGLMHVPSVMLLRMGLFTSRVMPVVYSMLLVAVIGYLAFLITTSETIGWGAAFLWAITPWAILFGRTGFEAPVAVLSLLCGVVSCLLLRTAKKHSPRFQWICVALTAAFWSGSLLLYHGYKFTIPLVAFAIVVCSLQNQTRVVRRLLCGVLLVVGLIWLQASVRLVLLHQRTSDLIPFSISSYISPTNDLRKTALNSVTNMVFVNKYILAGNDMLQKYLGAFSPKMWFITGDSQGALSVRDQGYLLWPILPFIAIGCIELSRKRPREWMLMLSLLLIAPLPSALSHVETEYGLRSGLLFPLLTIYGAIGMFACWKWVSRVKPAMLRYFSVLVVGLPFLASLGNFISLYLYRYPIFSAESFFFSERQLSHYLSFVSPSQHVIVLTSEPYQISRSYLFYTDAIQAAHVHEIQQLYRESTLDTYTYQNVTFTSLCPDPSQLSTSMLIAPDGMLLGCPAVKKVLPTLSKPATFQGKIYSLNIVNPLDSGILYRIYNDTSCDQVATRFFVQPTSLRDFAVESMDKNTYCATWLTRDLSDQRK